jgi:hypothetical protein
MRRLVRSMLGAVSIGATAANPDLVPTLVRVLSTSSPKDDS